MAGIYIHIPFCKKICSYCDFYKSTLISLIPEYLSAVQKELSGRSTYLQNETVDTIYLGGGTPSLLEPGQISDLINHITHFYSVTDVCEITLEANPDDLSREFLRELALTPVNRLSIGIQSFNDSELKFLNRRHNAAQSHDCINNARAAGFKNLSLDLIYGIPGLEMQTWQKNIELASEAEHISAYHLTIEPGTELSRKRAKGLLQLPDEGIGIDQFGMLSHLKEKGFIHYEISNLAKPGYYSKHNSNYWLQKKYLGAGPSAHSYDLESRQWNFADIKKYLSAMKNGTISFEREELNVSNHYNEYLMLSFRTCWGVSENHILNVFGQTMHRKFVNSVKQYLESGHILRNGDKFQMTGKGWLISDHIIPDFFMDVAE
jgi:oxygen-independent coproporphyrinogen-3 oxidase